MTGSKAKCWEFVYFDGEWHDVLDAEEEYGMFGLAEKTERHAEICLDADGIERMTWPDAWRLLKELIRVRDGYLGR